MRRTRSFRHFHHILFSFFLSGQGQVGRLELEEGHGAGQGQGRVRRLRKEDDGQAREQIEKGLRHLNKKRYSTSHSHSKEKKLSMANTQVPFDKLKLASAEIFFAILKRREWEVGTTITTGVLQQLRSGAQGKFAAPTGIGKPDPVSAFSLACYFSIRD